MGYNLAADLRSLGLTHPNHLQRDLMRTRRMQRKSGQAPSLRQLAAQHLGRDIQFERHSARLTSAAGFGSVLEIVTEVADTESV